MRGGHSLNGGNELGHWGKPDGQSDSQAGDVGVDWPRRGKGHCRSNELDHHKHGGQLAEPNITHHFQYITTDLTARERRGQNTPQGQAEQRELYT